VDTIITETIGFNWKFFAIPLMAFGYVELLKWMNQRAAAKQRISPEEMLSDFARNRELSEYDVFHLAAASWSVSGHQVDEDFNSYLQTLIMPYYVRDFIRKVNSGHSGKQGDL